MAFTKSFPKTTDKSVYPKWEEITLSDSEEKQIEEDARKENINLMKQCIDDARKIIDSKDMKANQTDIVNLAITLFEKQASHNVYWKENIAKKKFDSQ